MIIIAGWFDVAPEEREAVLERRRAGVLLTRAEPGCIEYSLSADSIDPGRVRIFERWTDRKAWDVHFAARLAHHHANPGLGVVGGPQIVAYDGAIVIDPAEFVRAPRGGYVEPSTQR